MSDDDEMNTLNLIGLGRQIDRLLHEDTENDRKYRKEKRDKPCTFTGGGDADESTHD